MMNEETTNNIPCFRCGVCCRKYQVRITKPEAQTIAERLGIDLNELFIKFTDPRWPGRDSFLLIHQDGHCVFLNIEPDGKTTGCSIHQFRPEDCRAWSAGIDRPECQTGLRYWKLAFQDGKITGSQADIEKFEILLKSLG